MPATYKFNYVRLLTQLVLFAFLIFCLLPSFGHNWDMFCWKMWSTHIFENGVGKAYQSGTNYPPLFLYMMYVFGQILGSAEEIEKHSLFIKLIPFLFDLLPVCLLIAFRRSFELRNNYHWFLLFNIAYFYNSIIWGQVDSIHSFFVLASLFVAFRYPVASILLFVLALNMKFQSIVFLPVLALCLMCSMGSFKKVLQGVLAALILQFLILLPFMIEGELPAVWKVMKNSIGYFSNISINAYNFWFLVLDSNPLDKNDFETFIFFNYKTWGFALFFLFSAIALWPLFILTLKSIKSKTFSKNMQQAVFLCAGLVVLIFFFFNTEMHERYSHPAMILLFFYGMQRGNFGLYFLVSIAYLLNMESVLLFFNIPHHTLIFQPEFIAWLFLLCILWGLFELYRNFYREADFLFVKNKFLKSAQA